MVLTFLDAEFTLSAKRFVRDYSHIFAMLGHTLLVYSTFFLVMLTHLSRVSVENTYSTRRTQIELPRTKQRILNIDQSGRQH